MSNEKVDLTKAKLLYQVENIRSSFLYFYSLSLNPAWLYVCVTIHFTRFYDLNCGSHVVYIMIPLAYCGGGFVDIMPIMQNRKIFKYFRLKRMFKGFYFDIYLILVTYFQSALQMFWGIAKFYIYKTGNE